MWDQLPELILTQIFSHLGRGDRANVAQVCQSWNRALSSPVLWRSVTVLIDRDLRGDFPLAGELAAKYGQHMRSLELAWSRPYILPREARITRNIQAEAGADFLTVVRTKNVQLKKLILTDWIFSCKWGNRGKLLYALEHFLGCQHDLEMLSLLNANLGMSDVLRLLASTSRGCTDHLAYLDLRGAFREWQAPHSNSSEHLPLRRYVLLTAAQCAVGQVSNVQRICVGPEQISQLQEHSRTTYYLLHEHTSGSDATTEKQSRITGRFAHLHARALQTLNEITVRRHNKEPRHFAGHLSAAGRNQDSFPCDPREASQRQRSESCNFERHQISL